MATTEPQFKPGPAAETIQAGTTETPPKRGRGRPRGSKTSASAPSRQSFKSQIAGVLMTINLGLYVIPGLRQDALDTVEIEALAKALDEQAKVSPRFRKYLQAALTATSGGQLFGVCVIIGARRAARHGVLPPDMDGVFGAMLASAQNMPVDPTPTFAPEPTANGTNGTG